VGKWKVNEAEAQAYALINQLESNNASTVAAMAVETKFAAAFQWRMRLARWREM